MLQESFFFAEDSTCEKWMIALTDTLERIVTSPGYSSGMLASNDLSCMYEFEAQAGYVVEIALEVETEHCCDYLQVL